MSRTAKGARRPAVARGVAAPCRTEKERNRMAAAVNDLGNVRIKDNRYQLGYGTVLKFEGQVGGFVAHTPRAMIIAQPKNAMRLVRTRAVARRPTEGVALVSLPVVRVVLAGRLTVLLFALSLTVVWGFPLVGSGGPLRLPRSCIAGGRAARARAARRLGQPAAALATVMLVATRSGTTR